VNLEYIKPNRSHRLAMQNAKFKNFDKQRRQKKKMRRAGKTFKYEDPAEEEEEDEPEEEDMEEDTPGHFYLRFKEAIPALVKKDMMYEDLWVLMKRPLVTTQSLQDIPELILCKAMWHNVGKECKLRVGIIGSVDEAKTKVDQYKYAFKSVNLSGYSGLIGNSSAQNFLCREPN